MMPPSNISGLPQGQLVGNYTTMPDAEKVAEKIIAGGVPHEAISIVGKDVRVVNNLRRRPSYPKVVGRAALQGAFFGLMIGLLLYTLGGDGANTVQLVSSMLAGVGIWVIFGVLGQSMRRKRTNFEMLTHVTAVTFDIVVSFEHAGKARQAMGNAIPTAQQTPQQPVSTQTPPDSGSSGVTPQEPQKKDQDTSAEVSAPAPQSPTRSGLADLPDGRPQFGVRVNPEDNASTSAKDPEEKK